MLSRALWLVLALWGAGLGAAAQYAKISVVFDLLDDAYPQAGSALGWIVSLVGLVGILFGVVAGLLVARLRYRRTLLTALWLGAGVSALQAFLPPFSVMLLLRAIEGASHLGVVIAAPTLIAQISAPAWRGTSMMFWGTFFGVAFALMTWFGRPMALEFGVGAMFGAHAIYLAFIAVILTFSLTRLPPEKTTPDFSLMSILRDHLTIYRSPYISAPAWGWLFYTFCFVSILTVLPPYLPTDQRDTVMGAMPLISIASSLTLGVLLLRFMQPTQVAALGFGLCVAVMIWLIFTPALPMACLALAAAMGLLQGAGFAAVPQLCATPATQAQANGAMAQMGNLGNTIGTPVMAAGLASFGYVSLPVIAGAAFTVGLFVHLVLGQMRGTSFKGRA